MTVVFETVDDDENDKDQRSTLLASPISAMQIADSSVTFDFSRQEKDIEESSSKFTFLDGLHDFFNIRHINLLISWLIVVVSFYVAFVAVLDLDIVHPFTVRLNATERVDLIGEAIHSTMSLFFLVIIGVFVGKLFFFAKLPPLFGMLLVGIAVRNIPWVKTLFAVNPYWNTCARKAALAVILIRLAVGLDITVLKKKPILPISLGVGSILAETAAIVLASYYIFNISLGMSIIFGFLLAATSPAVVVPAFLEFQSQGLGTEKGIPTLILASAGLDNILAITAFSIGIGIVFSEASLASTIVRSVVQLIVSAIVGVILGLAFRWFPRPDTEMLHVWRISILATLSAAITYGCMAISADAGGIIAVLLAAGVAAISWKEDNRHKTHVEAKSFTFIWNVLFQPLLFTLVGMEFRFEILTWQFVGIGVAILAIGCTIRVISLFPLSLGNGFTLKEQILISYSFFSKATVQAALVTTLLTLSKGDPIYEEESQLILVACVIAIIITSPLGLILLQFFGPSLLNEAQTRDQTTTTLADMSKSESNGVGIDL